MPFFQYTAKDRHGATQEDIEEAGSQMMLLQELRRRELAVVRIREVPPERVLSQGLPPRWHPAWWRGVRSSDVETGLGELASLLRSGVSLLEALKLVGEQTEKPRVRYLWRSLGRAISGGSSFSDALRIVRTTFSDYVVELIAAGEQSGELDEALQRAAEHRRHLREIRLQVVNALLYPVLAMLAAIAVSVYLVLAVLPKLETFLTEGGAQLPGTTQMMLSLSAWLQGNGVWLCIGLLLVIFCVRVIRAVPEGRRACDALLLHLPVLGKIFRLEGTAVVSRGLSVLLESGISVSEALHICVRLLGNRQLAQQLATVRKKVLAGEFLSESLLRETSFETLFTHMAAVAEKSGTLAGTFAETADYYEKELSLRIKRFSILLEPLVIALTAVIVGFVYISFFMALFSIADMA